MKETSKAMRRRWCEDERGEFPWRDVFQGLGIDVGCGPDKLPFDTCIGFDLEDGDANLLDTYFPMGNFDYLHASQVLEHMHDPTEALRRWSLVVTPLGYLVITVPSWELYEHKRWPSRWNPDHKSTWSMTAIKSPAPHHVHVPTWVNRHPTLECVLARELTCHYDPRAGDKDQTIHESDGVEPWIEMVFIRRAEPPGRPMP